jgi:excisionase family DNA binding protein
VDGAGSIDRLLDAEAVADWLSVTPAWVHEMARNGEMPAIKLGRYWRFSRQAIEAWLVERAQATHARRTG